MAHRTTGGVRGDLQEPKCWSVGVLEYWSTGVLECSSAGRDRFGCSRIIEDVLPSSESQACPSMLALALGAPRVSWFMILWMHR